MNLNCPKCNSENTQKLSAIVAGGTIHSRSHGTSVGGGGFTTGGLGGGVMSTSTTGMSQTELAKRLSAPRKKYWALFIVALGVISAPTVVGFLVGVPLGLYLFFAKNQKYNREVYPKLKADWDQSFYCHRCEAVFIPAA